MKLQQPKTSVPYPLAPEMKDEFEKKRKEFIKKVGVRISQARFMRMIEPTLKPTIRNIKINLKPTIKLKRKKWK